MITRGDVFLANLDPTMGAEIKKSRPVIVVSNNMANAHSSVVTVVPLTSKGLDKVRAFEVSIENDFLPKPSKAVIQQIRTLDKARLGKKYGRLDSPTIKLLNQAMRIHLEI